MKYLIKNRLNLISVDQIQTLQQASGIRFVFYSGSFVDNINCGCTQLLYWLIFSHIHRANILFTMNPRYVCMSELGK